MQEQNRDSHYSLSQSLCCHSRVQDTAAPKRICLNRATTACPVRRIRLHQDRFPVSRNQKPGYRYDFFLEILEKTGNGSVYNRARIGRSCGPVRTYRFWSLIRFAVSWTRLCELEIVFVFCWPPDCRAEGWA
jgi:hypothetical protein